MDTKKVSTLLLSLSLIIATLYILWPTVPFYNLRLNMLPYVISIFLCSWRARAKINIRRDRTIGVVISLISILSAIANPDLLGIFACSATCLALAITLFFYDDRIPAISIILVGLSFFLQLFNTLKYRGILNDPYTEAVYLEPMQYLYDMNCGMLLIITSMIFMLFALGIHFKNCIKADTIANLQQANANATDTKTETAETNTNMYEKKQFDSDKSSAFFSETHSISKEPTAVPVKEEKSASSAKINIEINPTYLPQKTFEHQNTASAFIAPQRLQNQETQHPKNNSAFPAAVHKYCRMCGKKIPGDSRFCNACGVQVVD